MQAAALQDDHIPTSVVGFAKQKPEGLKRNSYPFYLSQPLSHGLRRASSPCGGPFWCGANSNQKLSPQAGKVDTNGVSGRKGNGSEIPSAAICSPSVTAYAATRTLVGIWSSCSAAACNTPYSARLSPRCIAHWARSARIPRKRGRLKLQHKLGVQCRTPRGAIVSIPITPPSYTPARASVRFSLSRRPHRLKARAQDSARQAPSCIHAHRISSARFGLSSHLC